MTPFDTQKPVSQARSDSSQALNTLSLSERIKAFMARYDLSRTEMASVISTSPKTMEGWLDRGITPPACLLRLMTLLERSTEARELADMQRIATAPAAPRGRPFKRGNEYRFKRKAKG